MRPAAFWTFVALALAIAPAAAAAAQAPAGGKPAAPAPAAPAPAAGGEALLTLGMARPVGLPAAERARVELEAWLSRELGGRVDVSLFPDAKALQEAAASGGLDAGWLTPLVYVRAAEHGAVRPLVHLARGGFAAYRSVFFVRSDSRVRGLDDLQGRSMAWVERPSASGRLFARAHLKKLGRDPAKLFGAQTDLPDHRAVCQAVDEGLAEVGASISDERGPGETSIVDGCRSAGIFPGKFRVVERSEPIPSDVIAVRRGLPEPLAQRLRAALLRLAETDEGREKLRTIFQADGFADAADADFAPVREALKLAGDD